MALTAKLTPTHDYSDVADRLDYARMLSQPQIEFYRTHLAIVEQKRKIFERNVLPHVHRIMPALETQYELNQILNRFGFYNNFQSPLNLFESSILEQDVQETDSGNNLDSKECSKRKLTDSSRVLLKTFTKIRRKNFEGVKPESRVEICYLCLLSLVVILDNLANFTEKMSLMGDYFIYVIIIFATKLATMF